MKILHLISGLQPGGAEKMLLLLLKQSINDAKVQNKLIVLSNKVYLIQDFIDQKIDVKIIDFKKNYIYAFYQLIKEYYLFRPSIIQSWLHHADLIGYFLSIFTRNKNLIWTVRSSYFNKSFISKKNIYLVYLLKFFSRRPKIIIYNSKSSYKYHIGIGYYSGNGKIIHNGYDINNKNKNKNLLIENYRTNDKKIIAFVSRYHPIKGFNKFIKIAKEINKLSDNFLFIVVGRDYDNEVVNQLVVEAKIENIIFLGNINNMNEVYNSIDFLILTSKSESFPNVIAEAMLSGVICYSNDVGDASFIINNFGIIASDDLKKDAKKICELINSSEKYKIISRKGVKHIANSFNIKNTYNDYCNVYSKILNG